MTDPTTIALVALIGLGGGLLGGLAGLGGSVLILPGLAIVLGYTPGTNASEHHLYMAAAMITNVAVALGATRRHAKSGAIDKRTVTLLLPALLPAIVAGALLSDLVHGSTLKVGLGVLILLGQAATVLREKYAPPVDAEHQTPAFPTISTGAATGLTAGLLGVGGGVVAVTMLRCWARVPVRRALAASSAAMCISAAIGAAVKTSTLPSHGFKPTDAITLALIMSVGAVVGGTLGATLIHKLPEKIVSRIITLLLVAIALRLIIVNAG